MSEKEEYIAFSLKKFKKFRMETSLSEYLERMAKLEIKFVGKKDKEYPERLRQIEGAPIGIYIRRQSKRQRLESFCKVSLAVVGTRKATAYGREVVKRLVAGLCDAGVTIVSGLALGIDAIAHKTALDAGGKTIGVLGSGLDRIYPAENRQLAQKMVESGQGILVSEFPLGYPPYRENFPLRNRIVSGLSLGVLVVEGTDKSGTLLTAAAAASQGRDVFAVPGTIFSSTSKAPHILLKQGAKLVETIDDILEELPI